MAYTVTVGDERSFGQATIEDHEQLSDIIHIGLKTKGEETITVDSDIHSTGVATIISQGVNRILGEKIPHKTTIKDSKEGGIISRSQIIFQALTETE